MSKVSRHKIRHGLIILAVILLSHVNQSSAFIFSSNSSTTKTAGDVLLVLIPAYSFGTAWLHHDRQGEIQFIKSTVVTTLVTFGLKFAIDKERPDGDGNDSFPSGHTAVTFSSATFLLKRYGPKYAIPAYIGASFVGYSRIHADRHFFEDVAGGAVLGILSSYFFTSSYENISVIPDINQNRYGLHLNFMF